ELEGVGDRSRRDADAVDARAARLAVGLGRETVERLCEQARGRRLAGTARPREEVGMAHRVVAQRVQQRLADVILADDVAEELRPVLAVERLRRHGVTVPAGLRMDTGVGAAVRAAREPASLRPTPGGSDARS